MTLDQTARICRHVEPEFRDLFGGALSPSTFTANEKTYSSNGRYAARWLDTKTPATVPLSGKQARCLAADMWRVFDNNAGDWRPLADAIDGYAEPLNWTPQRIVVNVAGFWYDFDFLARLALLATVIRLHDAGPVLCLPPDNRLAADDRDESDAQAAVLALRFGGSFEAVVMPCTPDAFESTWPADTDEPPAPPAPNPPADQDPGPAAKP